MFECEVLAIYRAFQQADSFAREKGGVAKNICIFVDNLEAKLRIEACLAKKHGSTILEILSSSTARVREMLSGIKKLAEVYDSVQLRWIRSHTSGGSLAEIGNDRADQLAKVMMMMTMMMMTMMMMKMMMMIIMTIINNYDNDDNDGDGNDMI